MHSLYVMFIMCNVAALTFYATIYEDICICNKSIEKHVLGVSAQAHVRAISQPHHSLYCMPASYWYAKVVGAL